MATRQDFAPLLDSTAMVITSGQQASGAVDLIGMSLVGVRIPASFNGVSLSLQESDSLTGIFQDVYSITGNLVSFPVAVSRTIILNPSDLAGIRFLKLKSSTIEAADRSINLILRAL